MFFSNEHEPDLGDERFGGSSNIWDEPYNSGDTSDPLQRVDVKQLRLTIQMSQLLMSEEQLIVLFKGWKAAKVKAAAEAARQKKIAELEKQLAALKNPSV